MPTIITSPHRMSFDAVVYDEKRKPHYFIFKKILWWYKAVEIKENT